MRATSLLAMLALAGVSIPSGMHSAGFTRGAHTTRRRIDPVQRLGPNPDPDVEAWNAEVERKKAERRRK